MKRVLPLSIALSLVLTLSSWTLAIPKVMAVDLYAEQDGVYTSEVFHLPVRISNAELDISLLMSTFLRATLELRAGENYIQFHLNDLSISGHLEYDIFELFTRVTSADVALTLYIDTDGIVQGVPRVAITYYGLL